MKKILYFLLLPVGLLAQPVERLVKVVVAPDHTNWTYKTGEPVRFTISVLKHGNPVQGASVTYKIGPDMLPASKTETVSVATGAVTVAGGTMNVPGFLRCIATVQVDGKEYRGSGTAGFNPADIKPTVTSPADFRQFWETAKADLAKVPIDARLTLLPERCTEKVNVYHVNLQNWGPSNWQGAPSRLYGILCVPKGEGTFPALLQVPGAGTRPYYGDVANAEKGVVTFQIGIHGIPVNMDPAVYTSLASGAFQNYQFFNLDDRDRYYYKRVYLGCVRSVDFLASLPQVNPDRIAVTGGSQGGALSIVTAALDPRIKVLGAFYPALSDMTGYLNGRAGGWPHMFTGATAEWTNKADKIKTVGYYDVVNFARLLNVPGRYSWGFNDEVCPPTSTYSAYNVITAPKSLELFEDTGHWTYPEQGEHMTNWLLEFLMK
ncbi:acetylxylan esterase [Fibrella forsythiae]|uniref:Acetylxylan esterase n=1 Tax=Fibrella forsythiae TaxID=2817061 RepID=A0ABS3JGM2_9BACT|nr:acetylxylan esterase [Fibrella forsythiae]MBO0949147.1 acetylxylan esterase [Fibrella forsythiae]